MKKDTWVVVVILAVVAVAVIAIIFSSNNSPTQTNSTSGVADQQNQATPSPQQTDTKVRDVDVALKSKCATDGQAFYQNFYKGFTNIKSVWFDPQFHFNSKLSTCLVFISWNDTSIPTTWGSDVGSYTLIVTSNGIVFDVYSNQAVLQDSTVKTHVGANGKEQETDTLGDYPYSQNIPNSNIADFDKQLYVLMSE